MRRLLRWVALPIALFGVLIGMLLVGVEATTGSLSWTRDYAQLGAGFGAKVLGSQVFLAGRDPDDVLARELADFGWIDFDVDREARTVDARVFGGWLAHRHAFATEALGFPEVVLVPLLVGNGRRTVAGSGKEAAAVREARQAFAAQPTADAPWPAGNAAPEAASPALQRAVDRAFAPTAAEVPIARTSAVLVVHRAHLVAERYAAGYGPATRLHGWSMTKSVLATLCGILAGDGDLKLGASAPIAHWRTDARAVITTEHLLTMSSGLYWHEAYDRPESPAIRMLFGVPDMAQHAAAVPLAHVPGEVWYYSSGTTVVLSDIVREITRPDGGPAAFATRRLFAPIGARSFVIETDWTGTPVGSSYGWATARDWARFGLLYLQDGEWNGERILPDGFVDRATAPAPAAPNANYGMHWWLNAGGRFDGVPRDAYFANGFAGQWVIVIPSRDAVIVRMGADDSDGAFGLMTFVEDVLGALP